MLICGIIYFSEILVNQSFSPLRAEREPMALDKLKEKFDDKIYSWALLAAPGDKTTAKDKNGKEYLVERERHPILKINVRALEV